MIKMKTLDVDYWSKWESIHLEILDIPEMSKLFSPKDMLIGFSDPTGRITYSGRAPESKRKLNREFNQLDYFIPIIANRKYVSNLPSISVIMPDAEEDYLIVHPYENDEDDIESLLELFERIDETDQPIYGICILDSETADMSHGIAYIIWKDESGRVHLAFYDPLSYRRKKKRENGEIYFSEYDYAKQVFQWIKEESDVDFQIHDLSKHCMFRNKDEFDCPQYQMNAEYCYFYSLHFLYTWAHLGKSLTRSGLKKAVEKSYIIPMDKMSREYNKDMMKYKVIMFSFILFSLILYFENLDEVQIKNFPDIKEYKEYLRIISNTWKEIYGLSL